MTSHQNKCGLSSLLPMSCQERAEAFARRLRSRLSSLGSNDNHAAADENSWLTASENSVTSSQPRQLDPDLYFDFGDIESPSGSPEEDVDFHDVENVINEDDLQTTRTSDCHCSISENKKGFLINNVKTLALNNNDDEHMFNDSGRLPENNISQITPTDQIVLSKEGLTDKFRERIRNEEINEDSLNPSSDGLAVSNQVGLLNVEDRTYSDDCNKESLPQDINSGMIKIEQLAEINSGPEYKQHEDRIVYCNSLNCDEKLGIKDENSDNDNDIEEPIPRVRRCSSLKTGKTPPGTPGRKKIVRFADVLGLDLADVRTFLDEIPKVPNSAYTDLKEVDLSDTSIAQVHVPFHAMKIDKILVPMFQQPGGQPDFINRIRDNHVCLDNALVEDPITLSITGVVRVRNLDFHKTVHIRYTLDSWQTYSDVQATYVENSCDGFSDKFSFTLFASTLSIGKKIEFAIRFQCKGNQFWDNNRGANYCFHCLPPVENTVTNPSLTVIEDNWNSSLYY